MEWCRQLRETVPDLQVWAAGVCRLHSPPAWLTVETSITAPLRCPPTVQREVERTRDIDGGDIPFYTSPAWPAPTEGPPVMWLQHANQPGHIAGYPDDCEACGRDIGQYLHHLGVDQPGGFWDRGGKGGEGEGKKGRPLLLPFYSYGCYACIGVLNVS